jgi:hypothetical protein
MVYGVMAKQGAGRMIIFCQLKGRAGVMVSHYADLEEFFRFYPREKLEWYQVKGMEKIVIK